MSLCTLAQVKTQVGISGSGSDAVLTQLIAGVSAAMARDAGRVWGGSPCLEKTTLTQLLTVGEDRTRTLWLAAWPVVSITEIKEAAYEGFADVDALTVAEDYQLDSPLGAIHRIGWWLKEINSVRVSYIGGYTRADAWASGTAYTTGDVVSYGSAVYTCTSAVTGTTAPPSDAAHWTLATGQTALPDDLVTAALRQVAHEFQHRASPGMRGEAVQGASINFHADDRLLPGVRAACAGY